MLLAQLKSTQNCIDFGKHLTMEQAVELKLHRGICVESSKKWLDKDCWDIAGIMATKAQFCRETIQFSNHKNILQESKGGDQHA